MKLNVKYQNDVVHAQAVGCLLYLQVGYRALFVGTGFVTGLYVAFKPKEAYGRRLVIKLQRNMRQLHTAR